MKRKGMTVREAAEEWVRGMDAIQQGMIAKLMGVEPDEWREVTVPAPGDRVYVYDETASGNVTAVRLPSDDDESDETLYEIELDSGESVFAKFEDFEVEYDDGLPMWGTMWSFNDSADNWWLEEGDGIRLMSECGFRVYVHEEFGYFFGIDGAGYDFYEAHWIPLYKARGLQWHDKEVA